jgi:lysosomal acid lipase/cholesteryl ester hydrolase
LNKPVIILQHGFLDSFLFWLINGDKSLAFRLVDSGYDVWINNSRGNRFSKEHAFLDIHYPNPDMQNDIVNPDIKK